MELRAALQRNGSQRFAQGCDLVGGRPEWGCAQTPPKATAASGFSGPEFRITRLSGEVETAVPSGVLSHGVGSSGLLAYPGKLKLHCFQITA